MWAPLGTEPFARARFRVSLNTVSRRRSFGRPRVADHDPHDACGGSLHDACLATPQAGDAQANGGIKSYSVKLEDSAEDNLQKAQRAQESDLRAEHKRIVELAIVARRVADFANEFGDTWVFVTWTLQGVAFVLPVVFPSVLALVGPPHFPPLDN